MAILCCFPSAIAKKSLGSRGHSPMRDGCSLGVGYGACPTNSLSECTSPNPRLRIREGDSLHEKSPASQLLTLPSHLRNSLLPFCPSPYRCRCAFSRPLFLSA